MEFNLTVSISSMASSLKIFHCTIKNILPVPVAKNTDKTIQLVYKYSHECRQLEETTLIEAFLFLDEVGFKVSF